MRTALALSPHLDDAAFSCGGLLAQLGDAGWQTVMATAFTRSVPNPAGFALECQTSKGLAPEVDYMALRRAEDQAAAAILGVSDLLWLDLPEAPHRGYHSPAALFGAIRDDDAIWRPLADLLAALVRQHDPALVLAPQGLGSHVDHRQMIRAVLAACGGCRVAFYRDTPYAIRNQNAVADVSLGMKDGYAVDISAGLERKIAASSAYASQIGFQFGGPVALARGLRAFAEAEGGGVPGERFVGAWPDEIAGAPRLGHLAAIL